MKLYTYSTDGTSLFRREKSESRRGKPALPDIGAETEEEISFSELLERTALAREAINTLDRRVNRLPVRLRGGKNDGRV